MAFGFRRGLPLGLAATLLFTITTPVGAQQSVDDSLADRLGALERKLETLDRQAAELRGEIDALRKQIVPAAAEAGAPDDLMAVDTVDERSADLMAVDTMTTPASAPVTTGIEDIQTVSNQIPPNSASMFNPQISMIGNVVGWGGSSGGESRDSIALEEGELSLEAVVDPYAKAKFYIGFSQEGVEIEEGYAQFLHLPADTTAKVGKFRSSFGKFNTLHFHQWSTVDAPLVSEMFFGDEGLTDAGVSIARIFPNRWGLFIETTAEATRGSVDGVFEPAQRDDLLTIGHLKIYRDLSDSANFEIGGSWARGTLPEGTGHNTFSGVDLTYRWKPLGRSVYRSFLARTELLWNERDDQPDTAFGYYVAGDYQFARRWIAGLRWDSADHPDDPRLRDDGGSFVLTFRPSEFSLLRGQYRRIRRALGNDADEFLMQLQFAIGAHGAHTF